MPDTLTNETAALPTERPVRSSADKARDAGMQAIFRLKALNRPDRISELVEFGGKILEEMETSG